MRFNGRDKVLLLPMLIISLCCFFNAMAYGANRDVSSYDELVSAVSASVNNDTITLQKDIEMTGTLVINNKSIAIMSSAGNEWTLTKDRSGRFFEVYSSGKLTLENVILDGDDIASGVSTSGELTLDNVTIKNCTAGDSLSSTGGGIRVAGNGTLLVESGVIENNSAGIGAGIYATEGTVKITDITVKGNTAFDYGGGMVLLGSAGNYSMDYGLIENNSAERSNGGGLYIGNNVLFTMDDGVITGNSAESNGGGVYTGQKSRFIMDGELSFNGANAGGGAYIGNNSEFVVSDADIFENDAYNGGGVYLSSGSKLEFTGGAVRDNKVQNSGGGIYMYTDAVLDMRDAEISGNSADIGGGVYAVNANIEIEEGNIKGNEAADYAGGLALLGEFGDYRIFSGTIAENIAEKNNGGGIYIGDKVKLTMENGEILNNRAGYNGGGIYLYKLGEFIMDSGLIHENYAGRNGGGVYVNDGSQFFMESGMISSNVSEEAVSNYGGGGGVYVYGAGDNRSLFTMVRGEIHHNFAERSGGGVYVRNNGEFLMEGGGISENTAGSIGEYDGAAGGGGVFVWGPEEESQAAGIIAEFIMEAGDIWSNTSETFGGGVYMGGVSQFTMKSGNIQYNDTVLSGGGGVYLYLNSKFNMEYGFIEGNTANTNGGGVYVGGGAEFIMEDGNIRDNIAESNGGGIYMYNNVLRDTQTNSLTMYDGTVSNNKALRGGGIYVYQQSEATILDGMIYYNTADDNGGGIYVMKNGKLNTEGIVVITNNISAGNGGGIYTANEHYTNLNTAADTYFDENTAVNSYVPPSNADTHYSWIRYDDTSIYDHPLNNYDINYPYLAPYTVIFDTKGGSPVPSNQEVDYEELVKKPANPQREYYEFIHWVTEEGEVWDFDYDVVTENMTLYAVWRQTGTPPDGGGNGNNGNNGGNSGGNNGGNNGSDNDRDRDKDNKDDKVIPGSSIGGKGEDEVIFVSSFSNPPKRNSNLNYEEHFNYVVGYPDGNIKPENDITRGEVAAIFYRLLTDEARKSYLSYSNVFSDVSAEQWHNISISTMTNMGVLSGYPDGSFRPDAPITRAEFATIVAKLAAEERVWEGYFSDIAGHWAKEYIELAAALGWIQGDGTGNYRPNDNITRAEVMAMVNRVLERAPENTDDLLPGMIQWPDNLNKAVWYYIDVQEATNTHIYERKSDGYYETWKALIPNKF